MENLKKFVQEMINKELSKNKVWDPNDQFYKFRNLSIDQRGRVGEHLLRDVFKNAGHKVNYKDNVHGDWDIEIDEVKIEVKTASLDVNRKFQHEGIKSNKAWDMIALIDIAPNDIYINFFNKNRFEFNEKNGVFKLTNEETINIHFRGKDNTSKRATGAGYKFDLKEGQALKGKTSNGNDVAKNFLKEKEMLNMQ